MNFVLRSALAGAATGGRTFTGLAALAVTAPPSASAQPDRALAQPATRGVVGVLALTELVMDKLPQTPSRTLPGSAVVWSSERSAVP